MLLPLGQVFITPAAEQALQRSSQTPAEFLGRHAAGDWGTLPLEDHRSNVDALDGAGQILSVYQTTRGEKLWVITEGDRSATTVLTPDDY